MKKKFFIPVVGAFSAQPGDQLMVVQGAALGILTRPVVREDWSDMPPYGSLLRALTAVKKPRLRALCAWFGCAPDDHAKHMRVNMWLNYLNAKGFIEPTPNSWHRRYPVWTATDMLRAAVNKE